MHPFMLDKEEQMEYRDNRYTQIWRPVTWQLTPSAGIAANAELGWQKYRRAEAS